MLPNTRIKYIKSLQIKKYRQKHRSFIVEGEKNMRELLQSNYEIECFVLTDGFFAENKAKFSVSEVFIEKQAVIESMGFLKVNNAGFALVKIPDDDTITIGEDEILLALDDIRDPGNLGTIIRTADWYGIGKIVASQESAELYNPKVIQSSMGSFTRVKVYYDDLHDFFRQNPSLEVAGAFLEGEPVYDAQFNLPLTILLGNESKGISSSLEGYVHKKITIPRYGKAESLNVALSAAIICDNVRRKEK